MFYTVSVCVCVCIGGGGGWGVCSKQFHGGLNMGLNPGRVSLGDLRRVIFPICRTELAFLPCITNYEKYLERHCRIQEPLATTDYWNLSSLG